MGDEHDVRACLCERCANLRWDLEQAFEKELGNATKLWALVDEALLERKQKREVH